VAYFLGPLCMLGVMSDC